MASTYEFIIVGGGTAGCLLAHRLANSKAKPSVLVVEAGVKPEGEYLRAPFHRYHALALRPDLDHGYTSEPEPGLNGRQIPYTRGKGLGGSSVLNFGVYLYGSGEDYDLWAQISGDDDWKWENVKSKFHEIENYDFDGSNAYRHLADPSTTKHGEGGLLKVGLPVQLEKGVLPQMEALVDAGEKINLDPNSGDPIGVSVFPHSYSKEGRSTSAIAYLADTSGNLEVWTNAIEKLMFEGDKVTGVVAADGRKASASKEVILTAGAIDTPRLLLLNGIGPKDELSALNIPVKADVPGVGKHLQDHVMAFMGLEVDGATNDRYTFESNPTLQAEAEELWKKDQSGAFALQHSSVWGGFLKHPDLETFSEYKALSAADRAFLAKPSVPTYEFINNCLMYPPGTQLDEGNTYLSFIAFLMNPQSEGSITLTSSDPKHNPRIILNYLTHPYDMRIFREALRRTWTLIAENPAIKPTIKRTLAGPKSLSDEDLDAYARDNASTVWHANGTVKMGRKGEDGACVDGSGRVYGVRGLRVADLSVCPWTPNNHTQATAYLVGKVVAEKVVGEYALDQR